MSALYSDACCDARHDLCLCSTCDCHCHTSFDADGRTIHRVEQTADEVLRARVEELRALASDHPEPREQTVAEEPAENGGVTFKFSGDDFEFHCPAPGVIQEPDAYATSALRDQLGDRDREISELRAELGRVNLELRRAQRGKR